MFAVVGTLLVILIETLSMFKELTCNKGNYCNKKKIERIISADEIVFAVKKNSSTHRAGSREDE